MENIIPLIQLDKVYWWWRVEVIVFDKQWLLLRKRNIPEDRPNHNKIITLTQLLFDTDSGFLQSVKWKKSKKFIIWDDGKCHYMNDYTDWQYHSMILAQMTSDEERLEYIENCALLPN